MKFLVLNIWFVNLIFSLTVYQSWCLTLLWNRLISMCDSSTLLSRLFVDILFRDVGMLCRKILNMFKSMFSVKGSHSLASVSSVYEIYGVTSDI